MACRLLIASHSSGQESLYLRVVTAGGEWDEDLDQRGSRDRKLRLSGDLLLKFIGQQNELVL